MIRCYGNNIVKYILFSITLLVTPIYADIIPGDTGSAAGNHWQSSWLDLESNMHFQKGDELEIITTGNAENVIVRLLPEKYHPSSSEGIEGDVRKVPDDGVIKIKLERGHSNIKQISVHAGKEAWGKSIGVNNGQITVISVKHKMN